MPQVLSAQPRQWLSAIGLALMGIAIAPAIVWSQISPVVRDQFLSDPEFAEPRDPLLPDLPIERPLSPLERSALAVELNRLAVKAEQLYLAGQTEQAFQLWMREVRLRRILGYEAEIEAMQRVGLRAWQESRSLEVQLLTLRLREIQAELLSESPLRIGLLEAVAATFEVLRDIDSAIAVYETLIARATQAGDPAERQRLLENLAQLQESWFRFEVAGRTYQSLLNSLGVVSQDPLKEIQYLRGAIRNYEDAGELQTAIAYQQRLINNYEQTGQIQLIPALTLAIARNYREIDDLSRAQTFYTTTYSVALAQQQTDVASDALKDLTDIYIRQGKADDALYLLRQRLAVERLSYNGYGIMELFGQVGQFYEERGEFDAAIAAYKEALVIAEYLDHRDAYYEYRLQQLLFQQGRLTITPAEGHQGSRVGELQNPDPWNSNRRAQNQLQD